ncbi:MAG TPA: hypothetical protein VKB79_07555 [Bryobacteraceae bacterium]|nr:hypothetical protein [Bryobacteraceae bacterium]
MDGALLEPGGVLARFLDNVRLMVSLSRPRGLHEIVNRAGYNVHATFFIEHMDNFAEWSAASAHLEDQLAVWFQTRAQRLLRKAVKNLFEIGNCH